MSHCVKWMCGQDCCFWGFKRWFITFSFVASRPLAFFCWGFPSTHKGNRSKLKTLRALLSFMFANLFHLLRTLCFLIMSFSFILHADHRFPSFLSSHFLPCLPFLNGDPKISKGTIQIVQDNSSWWCQRVSDLKFIYYLGCSLSYNLIYLYVLVI